MKFKLIKLVVLLISFMAHSQQAINYKALIKDNLGNVIANQLVTVQFTILEGVGATMVYQEEHNPTTDANGTLILNIGMGTTLNGDYNTIAWGSDEHFLNVQIDSGSGLIDLGTTQFMAVPYALYAETSGTGGNATGLEALDEGNGTGWRLIGRDPNIVPILGNGSMDLTTYMDPSRIGLSDVSGYIIGTNGFQAGDTSLALGENSVALGFANVSSGNYSIALGQSNFATGEGSASIGSGNVTSGYYSKALGFYTKAESYMSTAIGARNIGGGTADSWLEIDPLFEIGNGESTPSNALTILKNGTITAPSFDLAEITDNKALITKEYADANYAGGATPSGLEALDEGNGTGWRLIGRDPNIVPILGNGSMDLTTYMDPSRIGLSDVSSYIIGTNGFQAGDTSLALGENSVAMGFANVSSGNYSIALGQYNFATGEGSASLGNGNVTSGYYSKALGTNTTASGEYSTAIGTNTIASARNATVIGRNNIGGGSETTWVGTDPLFEIGNGESTPSNALTVLKNGTITAPSFDLAEITDNKALITKEYADANYAGGAASTGLEALNEGNGIGWRLIGRDPNIVPILGNGSMDLTTYMDPSSIGLSDVSSYIIGTNGFQAGDTSLALGENSVAMGFANVSSGNYSIALGQYNFATGEGSASLGNGNVTSGYYSKALGTNTTASGEYSTAMGNQTIADDDNSIVVGKYNDNTTSISTLFQVGNGFSNFNRSNAFTVFQNGNATLAGILTQNSDRRLKKDIIKLSYGLEEILQLNPVSYHWKRNPDQPKSLGLIAQEVQTIIKEIVHVAGDENKSLSVSYTELIPVLIKAIQEQQIIITKQSQTIKNQELTTTKQTELLQTLIDRVEALEKHYSSSDVKIAKN